MPKHFQPQPGATSRSRQSTAVTVGWLALAVAVLSSAIVITRIRLAYLSFGLDRQQAMSWMSLYSTTAVVLGWVGLALLRLPRTATVVLAVSFAAQTAFVTWIAAHGGGCVFGCGPYIS